MRELMAILYRPVMDDGTIEGYNITNTKKRAELFRDLPVKYLQGSMRFFFHLEKVLKETTPFYLRTYQSLRRKLKRHLKPLGKIGDGIGLLYSWLKRILKRSPK